MSRARPSLFDEQPARRATRRASAGRRPGSSATRSSSHAAGTPSRGAQAEDQPLGQALARRERLGVATGSAPRRDQRAVALDRLDVAVAHVAQEAAGARARAPGTRRRASRPGCGASGGRAARSSRSRSARSPRLRPRRGQAPVLGRHRRPPPAGRSRRRRARGCPRRASARRPRGGRAPSRAPRATVRAQRREVEAGQAVDQVDAHVVEPGVARGVEGARAPARRSGAGRAAEDARRPGSGRPRLSRVTPARAVAREPLDA